MNIQPCAVADLSADDWAAWDRYRAADPNLAGPHFSSEYVRLIAQFRTGIEIARFEQDGRAVGFLAYRRASSRVAESIAGSFSEADGVVGDPNLEVDIRSVLKACGLRRMRMLRWVASQPVMAPFAAAHHRNMYFDVSDGFEAYRQARRKAGGHEIQDTLRKMRRAERELGELRMEAATCDQRILSQILAWKFDQLQNRRQFNPIREDWQFALLEQLVTFRGTDFSGMLSALYFGDHLVAGSLSVRSGGIINGWVTAYSPKYGRHSPGSQLFISLAQHAQSLGIRRVEMGCGTEQHKRSFGTGYEPVMDCVVSTNRLSQSARLGVIRARAWLSESSWTRPAWRSWQRLRAALSPNPARTS